MEGRMEHNSAAWQLTLATLSWRLLLVSVAIQRPAVTQEHQWPAKQATVSDSAPKAG